MTSVSGGAPARNHVPSKQSTPPSGLSRAAWFFFIWVCSVAVLAIVAGVIRWFVKP